MNVNTPAHDGVGVPLIAMFLGLGLCFLYSIYRAALPKPLPGIPHDEAAARNVLGSIPSMLSHLRQHGVLIPWLVGHNAKHNAPLIQFFGAPFAKPTLVLSDFQESQDILLRRSKEFDRAYRSVQSVEGIIPDAHFSMQSADPRFKGNKELVRDLMSPSFLHEVSAVQIYQKSLSLINLWSLKAEAASGRPFPARKDIFDATLDMINAAAFGFDDDLSIIKRQHDHFLSHGISFDTHSNGTLEFHRLQVVPEIAALKSVADYLGKQLISPLPRLTHTYSMLTNSKLRRDIVLKDEVIKTQLQSSMERLRSGDVNQRSATDFMVQREDAVSRKEGRDPDPFSKRTIDELFVYIVGGHETTSTSLSWALKLLSDHQSVQDKLRHTLQSSFPDAIREGRAPNVKEIVKTNIPYLDAVIEECLRIGQPTPLVVREAMVDTTLLGHRIPKGVAVFINSGGPGFLSIPLEIPTSVRSETSRAKRHGDWSLDDMHLFNPERWLKTDGNGNVVYDSQAGPFLSFSLGPRSCFGKRLAYLEMRMVMSLLIWKFRFMKLQDELATYKTEESVTVMPKTFYVGLELI